MMTGFSDSQLIAAACVALVFYFIDEHRKKRRDEDPT